MHFTVAQADGSCHPELLVPGAGSVISAALCYWEPGPEPGPGEGRLPRYTWRNAYAELREKLERLGERLGGEDPGLLDENQQVDREAAAPARGGFFRQNTKNIPPRVRPLVLLRALRPPL